MEGTTEDGQPSIFIAHDDTPAAIDRYHTSGPRPQYGHWSWPSWVDFEFQYEPRSGIVEPNTVGGESGRATRQQAA